MRRNFTTNFKVPKFRKCDWVVLVCVLSGCNTAANLALINTTKTTTSGVTSSPTPTAAITPSAKAVKIFFKQGLGGSFDTPPSGGTVPGSGTGLPVMRLFNPDGSTLAAAGETGINWPGWLGRVEIGISGQANTSARNSSCANFAGSTEYLSVNCAMNPPPAPSPVPSRNSRCGAPPGQFRISEVDCSVSENGTIPAASNGSGISSDGVYIRMNLTRNPAFMASTENLLVVLEYAASTINPAPANPTQCFFGGSFVAESCSDFVWRSYLTRAAVVPALPFIMLIPPTYNAVQGDNQASGTNIMTRQFVLPIASDPTLTIFQLSRTQSNFANIAERIKSICTESGISLPGNSPLCAGVIFYSMTIYRI